MSMLRTIDVALSFLDDVKPHVGIARRIIIESNKHFEMNDRLTLRASDFRDTLAIYNNAGTQKEIDDSVFNGVDVFIGFMHVRFGRPVGGSKSGAEHEYSQAIAAHDKNRKPKYILFGFSDEMVKPSTADGNQMELVKQFRNELKDKQLYFDWTTKKEFERKFREQLNLLVDRYKNDLNNYVSGELLYK